MFISQIKILLLIMLVGAGNVTANTNSERGISIGIDVGRAETDKSCSLLTSCDNSDRSDRFDVGFKFNTSVSAELGYTNFGTLFNSQDDYFNASPRAEAWTVSGIILLPLNERFGLFGRGGLARYDMNNSGLVEDKFVKNSKDLKPYFGAGISLTLSKNIETRLEYQYYTDISGVDGSKDNAQGMYVGLVYHL